MRHSSTPLGMIEGFNRTSNGAVPDRRRGVRMTWDLGNTPFETRPPLLCNCFHIYRSYHQLFAGYHKNFAELCVEHHLLRLRYPLVFEAIGSVFFDVCFYRLCLVFVSYTAPVPVHFVLRQSTQ